MLNKFRYLIRKNRCYCETQISSQEIEKMIEQGAILLDVRSPQEYEEGHLENAILLPFYEMKQKAKTILPSKEQKIIVYCSTGHRSKKAQRILEKLGYKNVYDLCK